jgi:hypothetical protein
MLLDIGGDNPDIAARDPLPTSPRDFGESFDLEYQAFRATEQSVSRQRNLYDAYERAIDALAEKTGQRVTNPYSIRPHVNATTGAIGRAVAGEPVSQSDPFGDAMQAFHSAMTTAREKYPDLPDQDGIEEQANAKAKSLAMEAAKVQAAGLDSGIGTFLGTLAGAASDPVNVAATIATLPFGGEGGTVTAARAILATGLREAAIAGGSQAAVETMAAPYRKEIGIDGDPVGNIVAAATGGAVLGAGAKALGAAWTRLFGRAPSLDGADAFNVSDRSAHLEDANPLGPGGAAAHEQNLEAAGQAVTAGRLVDPAALIERDQLSAAYDEVLARPLGPVDDPLVRLQPSDVENILVERGPAFGRDGEITVTGRTLKRLFGSERGFGLVKIIWKHGERSRKAGAGFDVTRDDVIDFPNVLREYEPAEVRGGPGQSEYVRQYQVERDGRVVVYAISRFKDNADHLVSIHVAANPEKVKLSPRKQIGPGDASSSKLGRLGGDTAPETFGRQSVGRAAGPTERTLPPGASRVYTAAGRSIDVQNQVVELGSLVPSHTDDLTPNPAFPPELQPRERSRAASEAQIGEIAANLQPDRLGPSADAATGAPVVGPDNIVESGNGRTLALRRAYSSGAADGYRAFLEAQGYDVSSFRQPVLIRRRISPMSDGERAAFALEANSSPALSLSTSERAKADARMVDRILDLHQGGDTGAAANRGFVNAFVKGLPSSERGAIVDANGALSQEGRRRIEAALLARAYGDQAPSLLGKLLEAGDNDIKAIGGALQDVSAPWARMRAAAAEGRIAPSMDVTADLIAAVQTVERARAAGTPVADLVAQGALFGDGMTDTARSLLASMFRESGFKRPVGRAALAERLSAYVREAEKTVPGANIFGEQAASPTDILAATDPKTAQQSLLAQDARASADRMAAPAVKDATLGDARRVAATIDPDIPLEDGTSRKASELLDEAAERKRVAQEIADACLLAGGGA